MTDQVAVPSAAEVSAPVEALLLLANEPVSETELAEALGVPVGVIEDCLAELVAFYDETGRGFELRRLVGIVGVLADKDAVSILDVLEPALDEVVITQPSSRRAMDVEELGDIARDVFGEDRVRVVERLDDAIQAAVDAAESGSDEGVGAGLGAGVLVTGSVALVGEARVLLRADR